MSSIKQFRLQLPNNYWLQSHSDFGFNFLALSLVSVFELFHAVYKTGSQEHNSQRGSSGKCLQSTLIIRFESTHVMDLNNAL